MAHCIAQGETSFIPVNSALSLCLPPYLPVPPHICVAQGETSFIPVNSAISLSEHTQREEAAEREQAAEI